MNLAQLAPLAQVEIETRSLDACPANNEVCPGWIVENFDRYMTPLWEHVVLTVFVVVVGFAIAFGLAILAHRKSWAMAPISVTTQVLYTIPSIAAFFILQPLVGRGFAPAAIALIAYTLFILFANFTTGLQNVPADVKDAARGMGLTPNQLLWKVELPLALPEIFAGLRIATTTTIGLVALAFFAGYGGLGQEIDADIFFKGNVIAAGGLCLLLAAISDLLILGIQRVALPWRRVGAT
ncbi:ABC transporter permease [Thermoleophilia bacterium SCSIO 60948]|nr:ABC transporter permease [Thermoleophilia bacterium SCSIO 60948]